MLVRVVVHVTVPDGGDPEDAEQEARDQVEEALEPLVATGRCQGWLLVSTMYDPPAAL